MAKRKDKRRGTGNQRNPSTSGSSTVPVDDRSLEANDAPGSQSPQPVAQECNPCGMGSAKFNGLWLVAVIIAALLRVTHVLQTVTVPTVQEAVGDARGYLDWADRIAGGAWYGTETFYQAPLYPYFLAVLIVFLGDNLTTIRLTQALLGTLGVGLLGRAVRNVWDPRTGVVATFLFAAYPPSIYYDGIIQKASLASFLLCLLLWLLSHIQPGAAHDKVEPAPRKSPIHPLWVALGTGLALSLLCLTRENALLWVPIVPAWIVWCRRSAGTLSVLKNVAAFAAGLAIVFLPVAARNASLGGEWSPTTFQSGPNFYIGNGLHATGVYEPLVEGHESPEFERADAQRLAEYFSGRPLSPREVSRFWMVRSLTEIAEEPGRWLKLMTLKTFMAINHYEVPDVESYDVHRFWSLPLGLGLIWNFGLLMPFAAAGIYLSWRSWRDIWVYHALLVVMLAAIVGFFILGRYRLPLVPLLMPFAAHAMVSIFRSRRMTARQRVFATVAAVLAFLASQIPVHDQRGLTGSAYMNVGVAAGRAGDAEAAVAWIGRSMEVRGETALSLYNLAGAQIMSGRPNDAIDSLKKAKAIDNSLVQVDMQLAGLYEQSGDVELAKKHYRQAIQIEPYNQLAIERLRSLERD